MNCVVLFFLRNAECVKCVESGCAKRHAPCMMMSAFLLLFLFLLSDNVACRFYDVVVVDSVLLMRMSNLLSPTLIFAHLDAPCIVII